MASVTVTDLTIYPLKGAQDVSVETVQVTPLGIPGDREFVIWEDGKLVDQKADQWVASIGVELDQELDMLRLSHHEQGEYEHVVSDDDETRRGKWVLDELNTHLDQAVPMDRFRMNVTLQGLDAYREDELDQLFNDTVGLGSVTPAERCVIVSTDQKTGERPQNNLMRTLGAKRMKPKEDRYASGMKFGNYMTVERAGHLSVGDTLTPTFVGLNWNWLVARAAYGSQRR